MSHIYAVVATKDSDIETCEVFSGVQLALGRAFQLASNKAGLGRTDLFDAAPAEETLPDGTLRWVFMDTNRQSVVVFYRPIADSLLSQKDPNSVVLNIPPVRIGMGIVNPRDVAVTVTNSPGIIIDFLDPRLPVGWKFDGTPAFMSDMEERPSEVKDPLNDLTDAQKWALVTARIRKNHNWFGTPKGHSGTAVYRHQAIKEVLDKTALGQSLRDFEMENLHALREDLVCTTID